MVVDSAGVCGWDVEDVVGDIVDNDKSILWKLVLNVAI